MARKLHNKPIGWVRHIKRAPEEFTRTDYEVFHSSRGDKWPVASFGGDIDGRDFVLVHANDAFEASYTETYYDDPELFAAIVRIPTKAEA